MGAAIVRCTCAYRVTGHAMGSPWCIAWLVLRSVSVVCVFLTSLVPMNGCTCIDRCVRGVCCHVRLLLLIATQYNIYLVVGMVLCASFGAIVVLLACWVWEKFRS